MLRIYELCAVHDRCKSFYGKAKVIEKDDGGKELVSYSTHVAGIDKDGKPYVNGFYSVTTLRHIREFLQQHNCFVGSKQEMSAYYQI